MEAPKEKPLKAREPKAERFDPFWNGRSGTVASKDEYLIKLLDRPGFHRGAKIRKP